MMRFLGLLALAGGAAFIYWRLSPPSDVIGSYIPDTEDRRRRMVFIGADQDPMRFI